MTIFAFRCIRTHLLNELRHNQIQDLHLSGLGLSTSDLFCLLTELKQNYSVHSLNLSDCTIDSSTAIKLNSALHQNRTIHTLALNNCNLNTSNFKVIAYGIAKNSSIIRLELQNNNLGDNQEEFQHCLDLIKSNTALRRIDLSGNNLIQSNSLEKLNNGNLYELIFPATQIGTKFLQSKLKAKL